MKIAGKNKKSKEAVKKSKEKAPQNEKKVVDKFMTGDYSLKIDKKTGELRMMADHPCRCPLCNEDEDNSKRIRYHMTRTRKAKWMLMFIIVKFTSITLPCIL